MIDDINQQFLEWQKYLNKGKKLKILFEVDKSEIDDLLSLLKQPENIDLVKDPK